MRIGRAKKSSSWVVVDDAEMNDIDGHFVRTEVALNVLQQYGTKYEKKRIPPGGFHQT